MQGRPFRRHRRAFETLDERFESAGIAGVQRPQACAGARLMHETDDERPRHLQVHPRAFAFNCRLANWRSPKRAADEHMSEAKEREAVPIPFGAQDQCAVSCPIPRQVQGPSYTLKIVAA